MLTENGRQPWIVQGLMKTTEGQLAVGRARREVWISLVVFVLIFAALGAADVLLMLRYARRGLPDDRAAVQPQRAGEDPGARLLGQAVLALHTLWFILLAILWTGFFVLEGFDFGVGVLHTLVGRTDAERRVAINTIGPWWDGNEVWLIVAGAGTFAAFPAWYATWFSALYLALLLVLCAR